MNWRVVVHLLAERSQQLLLAKLFSSVLCPYKMKGSLPTHYNCWGVIKARLKTSGKKSFDMDPGWPGIEQDLKNVATIPIPTRKAWLKQKRQTGEFENCFPRRNAKPRCSVSQVKKERKPQVLPARKSLNLNSLSGVNACSCRPGV